MGKLLWTTLFLAAVVCLISFIGTDQYVYAAEPNIAKGSGTEADPYIIQTADELNEIRNDLSGYYVLETDINLSQAGNWEPIGDELAPFSGSFVGNGYSIRDLTIERPNEDDVGLFGYTAENASIAGVRLIGVHVTGHGNVGGLVGSNGGSIVYSSSTGFIHANANAAGGLVGVNLKSIEFSFSKARINGQEQVGGLVGINSAMIAFSYAAGSVDGTDRVGGLAGKQSQSSSRILFSYSVGRVTGQGQYVGGLVGASEGAVENSVWDIESSGQGESAGGIEVIGLTTHEMKRRNDLVHTGFIFMDIWTIDEGESYPYHRGSALRDVNVEAGEYKAGEKLEITLTFDKGIYGGGILVSDPEDNLVLQLNNGATAVYKELRDVKGASESMLVFEYTVVQGDDMEWLDIDELHDQGTSLLGKDYEPVLLDHLSIEPGQVLIDTTPPVMRLFHTLDQLPAPSETIGVVVNESNVVKKYWEEGDEEDPTVFDDAQFSVEENGTYYVSVKDQSGNETTQSIEITNILTVITNGAEAKSTSLFLYGEILGHVEMLDHGFAWRATVDEQENLKSLGADTADKQMTVVIDNMPRGTEFFYRAYVTTEAGTFYGVQRSIKTAPDFYEPVDIYRNLITETRALLIHAIGNQIEPATIGILQQQLISHQAKLSHLLRMIPSINQFFRDGDVAAVETFYIEQMENAADAYHDYLAALTQYAQELHESVATLKEGAAELTEDVEQLNDEIAKLKSQIDQLTNENKDLIDDLSELTLQFNSIASQLTELLEFHKDRRNIQITFAAGDSAYSVTQDVYLPLTTEHGGVIEWTSSNDALVIDGSRGIVHRPAYAEGDMVVGVQAAVKNGKLVETIDFMLQIQKEDMNDLEAVEMAYPELSLGFSKGNSVHSVTDDVYMSTVGNYDTTINWSSSHPDVIDMTGNVTRPLDDEEDVFVRLTASISRGEVTLTKRFVVHVLKQSRNPEEAVQSVKDALHIGLSGADTVSEVRRSIQLVTMGADGTTITWSTSDASVIEADGTVTRPAAGQGDQVVTITAMIAKGGITEQKQFTVTVKAYDIGRPYEMDMTSQGLGLERVNGKVQLAIQIKKRDTHHQFNGHFVVIQFMEGTEVLHLITIEKDQIDGEVVNAAILGADETADPFKVKVFVYDSLNTDPTHVQTNLADPIELH